MRGGVNPLNHLSSNPWPADLLIPFAGNQLERSVLGRDRHCHP